LNCNIQYRQLANELKDKDILKIDILRDQ